MVRVLFSIILTNEKKSMYVYKEKTQGKLLTDPFR